MHQNKPNRNILLQTGTVIRTKLTVISTCLVGVFNFRTPAINFSNILGFQSLKKRKKVSKVMPHDECVINRNDVLFLSFSFEEKKKVPTITWVINKRKIILQFYSHSFFLLYLSKIILLGSVCQRQVDTVGGTGHVVHSQLKQFE